MERQESRQTQNRDNTRFHLLHFNLSLPLTLRVIAHAQTRSQCDVCASMQIDFFRPGKTHSEYEKHFAGRSDINYLFGAFQPWRHETHSQILNCRLFSLDFPHIFMYAYFWRPWLIFNELTHSLEIPMINIIMKKKKDRTEVNDKIQQLNEIFRLHQKFHFDFKAFKWHQINLYS